MNTQDDNANPWQRLRATVARFATPSLSLFPACRDYNKDKLESELTGAGIAKFSVQADMNEAITGLMAIGKKSNQPEDLTPLKYLIDEIKKNGEKYGK